MNPTLWLLAGLVVGLVITLGVWLAQAMQGGQEALEPYTTRDLPSSPKAAAGVLTASTSTRASTTEGPSQPC
jgi:hypothetical protein